MRCSALRHFKASARAGLRCLSALLGPRACTATIACLESLRFVLAVRSARRAAAALTRAGSDLQTSVRQNQSGLNCQTLFTLLVPRACAATIAWLESLWFVIW